MTFGAHDRNVQGLVSVGLWTGDPIPQTPWVGSEDSCNHGVCAPDIGFLAFWVGIDDNPDRVFVIDLFERDGLIQHFAPNGKNPFVPSLHAKGDAFRLQKAFNALTEALQIDAVILLSVLEFLLQLLIYFGLRVLQSKVFKLRFNVVQAHSVGQWRKNVQGFTGDFQLLVVGHPIQCPHVVQAVSHFDQDDPDIIADG